MKNDPSGSRDRYHARGTRIVEVSFIVEECSYQEIAKIVDYPVGIVCSRLRRGRRMLHKALCRIVEDQGVIAGLRPDEG
jgi:RNA polymerase sigma-70 factor (ECF subfamily)